MKIDIISDTHGFHRDPFFNDLYNSDADLLIHAGDLTLKGDTETTYDVNEWLGELPHPDKVIIAGNHDILLARNGVSGFKIFNNATYLLRNSVKIDNKIIYGDPQTPWAFKTIADIFAFGKLREEMRWSIPHDVDILLTHSPPLGHNDMLAEGSSEPGVHIGDKGLLKKIIKIKPKYNIFGHIHEGYGISKNEHTTFINASSVNESYNLINDVIRIEL